MLPLSATTQTLRLRGSYTSLIVLTVLALLLGMPLREMGFSGIFLMMLLMIGSSIAAFSAGNSKRSRWAIRLGVAPLAVLDFLLLFTTPPTWQRSLTVAAHAVLFLVAVVTILHRISRQRSVTVDTLLGGICVYLLIGFTFVFLFELVETAKPGSFIQAGKPIPPDESGHFLIRYPELIYFSFVTLTTVGYGDITPALSLSRALGVIEALTGQIYITTLLAMLVSSYIAERQSTATKTAGPT